MKKKKSQHGGARDGAGLKPADPSGAKVKKGVWLTPAEVRHLEGLGASVGEALAGLVRASMQRKAK